MMLMVMLKIYSNDLTLDGAETSVAELTSENLMETLEVNSLSVNHVVNQYQVLMN